MGDVNARDSDWDTGFSAMEDEFKMGDNERVEYPHLESLHAESKTEKHMKSRYEKGKYKWSHPSRKPLRGEYESYDHHR